MAKFHPTAVISCPRNFTAAFSFALFLARYHSSGAFSVDVDANDKRICWPSGSRKMFVNFVPVVYLFSVISAGVKRT